MSNSDWWAKKLGSTAPAAPAYTPPQAPIAPLPGQYGQPYAAPAPSSKASSASHTEFCPQCGSGNYMRPNASIAPRCYDCGYPIEQSGSSVGRLAGARVEGPTVAAKGNDATNNYNPTEIIGHI